MSLSIIPIARAHCSKDCTVQKWSLPLRVLSQSISRQRGEDGVQEDKDIVESYTYKLLKCWLFSMGHCLEQHLQLVYDLYVTGRAGYKDWIERWWSDSFVKLGNWHIPSIRKKGDREIYEVLYLCSNITTLWYDFKDIVCSIQDNHIFLVSKEDTLLSLLPLAAPCPSQLSLSTSLSWACQSNFKHLSWLSYWKWDKNVLFPKVMEQPGQVIKLGHPGKNRKYGHPTFCCA